jgi:serine acetyltransferase
MNTVDILVQKREKIKNKFLKRVVTRIIHFYGGVDIGIDTKIGKNVVFKHGVWELSFIRKSQ